MNINTELVGSVGVMKLVGALDASCYRDVIASAEQTFKSGSRNLLLDMSEVNFMSSSGLVALHSIALIFRGEGLTEGEEGWSAFHAVSDFVESAPGREKHLKLLNPHPRVQQTLHKTGFAAIFEIFEDRSVALASFN